MINALTSISCLQITQYHMLSKDMVLGTVVISGEALRASTGSETWLTIDTGDGSQGAKLRTCIVFTVCGVQLHEMWRDGVYMIRGADTCDGYV